MQQRQSAPLCQRKMSAHSGESIIPAGEVKDENTVVGDAMGISSNLNPHGFRFFSTHSIVVCSDTNDLLLIPFAHEAG